jgi:hypothetical protein
MATSLRRSNMTLNEQVRTRASAGRSPHVERPEILFFIDESFPRRQLGRMMTERGHRSRWLDLGTKDPAILEEAELNGAVIIASDTFFYNALRQGSYFETRKRRIYERAGIVSVAGEWASAREQLKTWIPLIETLHIVQSERSRRTVILIRGMTSVVVDA